MRDILLRPQFQSMKISPKISLLQDLAERYEMNLLSLFSFARWGQSCTTGVFEKDRRIWVFVPGDKVTLGWKEFVQGMGEDNQIELREILQELEYPGGILDYLQSVMSPVRQVWVPPMLVGQKLEQTCWEPVSFWDVRLQKEHRDWLEQFWQYEQSNSGSQLNLVGRARFDRIGSRWQAFLYRNTTYSQLREGLEKQNYSLPTADEWSYLCGGGCRTLFPWGDGLDSSFHLHHFSSSQDRRPYDLEQPNFFGLSIAFDPYRREVVQTDTLTTCGGDGGCNICGGLGPVLGYLPCSPHWKPEIREEETLNGDFDFYRPVIRVD